MDSESSNLYEQGSIERIIDAAGNRCREGFRVVEDYCRFVKNDSYLSSKLKSQRHLLQQAFQLWDPSALLAARDTPGDVGTTISTPTEQSRSNIEDVLKASCKRIGEALRSLEEFSKIKSPEAAARFEALRYEFYSVEKRLFSNSSRRELIQKARLYLLVTESQCSLPWEEVVETSIDAGVDVIQLREKQIDDGELLRRAKWIRSRTKSSSTLLIINDRPDIALLAEADGVHVGQEELPVAEVRRLIGEELLIGLSTHQLADVEKAMSLPVDYLGVGPVFSSRTKSFSDLAGLTFVSEVVSLKDFTLPWFAIGGVNLSTLEDLKQAGGTRVAVCEAICGSTEVRQSIERWQQTLDS